MQDPVRYENNKTSTNEIVEIFLPKLINTMRWSTGELVLDYGCGAGSTGYNWILPKAVEYNSKLHSVDVSPKMLAFAIEKYPHERISYGVGNIVGAFPFKNVIFDKIFAVQVFHFIRDIRKALAGFHKILKPGGQFGFTTRCAGFSTLQAFKEFANNETWKPYMTDYEQFYPVWSEFTKGQELIEMRQLLESSGFRVVELEFLKRNYHFDSIDSLLEIALSANPCLNNIPKDLYGAFKEDLKKFYFDYDGIPRDSQTFDLKYDFIWGVIEKV